MGQGEEEDPEEQRGAIEGIRTIPIKTSSRTFSGPFIGEAIFPMSGSATHKNRGSCKNGEQKTIPFGNTWGFLPEVFGFRPG
jgi:hypothetical protein